MLRKIIPIIASILINSFTYGNESEINDKSRAKRLYDFVIKEGEPIAYGKKGFGSKVVKIGKTQYQIIASSENLARLEIEIFRGNKLEKFVDELADGSLDEVNIGYKKGSTTRDYAGRITHSYETNTVGNPKRFNKKYLRHLGRINRFLGN